MNEKQQQFVDTFGETENHQLHNNCESAIVSADETVMMAPKGESVMSSDFIKHSSTVKRYETGTAQWDNELHDIHIFHNDDSTDRIIIDTAKIQELSECIGLSVESITKRAKSFRYFPIVVPTENYNYVISPVANVSNKDIKQTVEV